MGITLKNAINVEKSRIDNLLTAETLDANSELIDIRVGYDGTTYDSAGDAVRTQVNELKDDLDEWYTITLYRLVEVARKVSSKYTRSKVRKAITNGYQYVIDELLHSQPRDEKDKESRQGCTGSVSNIL